MGSGCDGLFLPDGTGVKDVCSSPGQRKGQALEMRKTVAGGRLANRGRVGVRRKPDGIGRESINALGRGAYVATAGTHYPHGFPVERSGRIGTTSFRKPPLDVATERSLVCYLCQGH
ncbi:hypothetical protein Bbelb_296750 [Branchiostoma belcheri]|nr:hypothetical protein Bbelb_296750 [Branchiostoma belcheri]